MRNLQVFGTEEELAEAALEIFLKTSPRSVALSGGETPRLTYQKVARNLSRWDETVFCLLDERHVPPDDPRSNALLVRETFGASARLVAPDTSVSPAKSAEQYDAALRPHWPVEFAFLGLGEDGHVASIFPGSSPAQVQGLAAHTFSEATGTWRVTLTMDAINEIGDVVFLVAGSKKEEALWKMMRDEPIPASEVRPVGRLIVLADKRASGLDS